MDDFEILKRNKPGAWELFYKKQFLRAYHYITKNNGSMEDVEGIFHDALLKLLGNIEKSDFQLTSTLSNYFFGIIKNKWREELRKRKAKQKVHDDSDLYREQLYSRTIEEKEKQEVLIGIAYETLQELSLEQRVMLKMRFIENLSIHQISEKLRRKENGVRVQLHRNKKKWRKKIQNHPLYKNL